MIKKTYNILKFILTHPIGRKKVFKALFRFFYWQLFSRLNLAKTEFTFINNIKLKIKPGQTVATGNYYVGLLEFSDMCFVAHYTSKNSVFFDIGSNIGTYALIASGVSGADTYAFEPVPKTFNSLKNNININKLQNKIMAFNIGLADKNGILNFTTNQGAKNHITKTYRIKDTVRVNVKQLDEFKEKHPTIIKCDAEGYEVFILNGARDILNQKTLKAIIIEENKEREKYNTKNLYVHKIISSYGFEMYKYYPYKRELLKIDEPINDNMLFIRDFESVSEKVKAASPINVFGLTI